MDYVAVGWRGGKRESKFWFSQDLNSYLQSLTCEVRVSKELGVLRPVNHYGYVTVKEVRDLTIRPWGYLGTGLQLSLYHPLFTPQSNSFASVILRVVVLSSERRITQTVETSDTHIPRNLCNKLYFCIFAITGAASIQPWDLSLRHRAILWCQGHLTWKRHHRFADQDWHTKRVGLLHWYLTLWQFFFKGYNNLLGEAQKGCFFIYFFHDTWRLLFLLDKEQKRVGL